MADLNRRAAEIMLDKGVSTCSDLTGFGLIGHLYEVLAASGLRARLHSGSVPYFDDAVRLAEDDIAPGGSVGNFKIYGRHVRWADDVPDHEMLLMNDAQTSGGLVIFVPAKKKDDLLGALTKEGIVAAHIGDVTEEEVSNEHGVSIYVQR
jgi:selenide,water dikinase